jgi:serine/threonine-protein kinase
VALTAHTVVELFLEHAQEPPKPPSAYVPDLDPLLEDIILRALAKERTQRHASAKELRLELREVAVQLAETAEGETVISQRRT